MQEAIGQNVVRALMAFAGARGAHCELELVHSCLSARGAEQPSARVRTMATAGWFTQPEALAELWLALGRPPGGGSSGSDG